MAPSGMQVGDELPTLTPARPKRDPFHDGNEIRLNPIATSRKEGSQAIERPAELTLVVENLAPEVKTEDCAPLASADRSTRVSSWEKEAPRVATVSKNVFAS